MSYLFIITMLTMLNQDFGSLLDADISEASFLGDMKKTERPHFDIYQIADSKKLFLDQYQCQFTIATRDDNTIRDIYIYLPSFTDKDILVKNMTDVYGEGKIMVVDQITSKKPLRKLKGKFGMSVKETTMTLKEGTMSDEVKQVIWEIEDFQVMLYLGDPKGTYFVRFTKDMYNKKS